MSAVWVRGQGGVMVRADSIIALACADGSLDAECMTGRTVRLVDSGRPGALLLALLDEIGRAGADERLPVVINPPAEQDSAAWRREYAHTLLDRLTEEAASVAGPSGPGRGLPSRCRRVDGQAGRDDLVDAVQALVG